MDPWNEEAREGGSRWGIVDSNAVGTVSEPTASSTARASPPVLPSASTLDPWAEGSSSAGPISPAILRKASLGGEGEAQGVNRTTTLPTPGSSTSRDDFDPWGGGSAPIAPLGGIAAHSSTYESDNHAIETTLDDEYTHTSTDDDRGWQPSEMEGLGSLGGGAPTLSIDDQREDAVPAVSGEDDDAMPTHVDEDDPWGSGAQARRIKAEREAMATAQQMEILRIQDEARGSTTGDRGTADRSTEGEADDDASASQAQKDDAADTSKAAAAPAPTTGGWRSLFTRGTAKPATFEGEAAKDGSNKAATSSPRTSTDVKGSPGPSMATLSAPRLWQAPSIRTNHARTGSDGGMGSVKEITPTTTQGPGWEVTTKKQPAASGGLGSALSRLGQSLQRPPVVSAQESTDSSVDIDERGIEWEAGTAFEQDKKTETVKPAPDLLSNDLPKESTVTRLLGRWRGKPADAKDAQSGGNDLDWLENMGGPSSSGPQATAGGASTNTDDDWLAFLEEKKPATEQQSTGVSTTLKPGEKIHIPIKTRTSATGAQPSASLAPPPRLGAPPSGQTSSHRPGALIGSTGIEASPDLDEFSAFDQDVKASANTAGHYRDEVDSYDDTLLRTRPAPPRKSNSFLANFTSAGQTIRPYTFDDEEHEEEHKDFSAFRDQPDATSSIVSPRTSTFKALPPSGPPSRQATPVQSAAIRPTVTTSMQPPLRQGTPVSGGGLLPPPPSANRIVGRPTPPTASIPLPTSTQSTVTSTGVAPKQASRTTLSQGKTLTNDDLSFFENL